MKKFKELIKQNLQEWSSSNMVVPGYNMPAVQDSELTAFNIERPEVLSQINAYLQSKMNEKQHLNPQRALLSSRAKLNLIGLDFGCTGKEPVQDGTVAEYKLTQYGGRYGWDMVSGDVVDDDGISHRLGYPLKIVAEFTKAPNGLFEIDLQIVPDMPEETMVGESVDFGMLEEHTNLIPESEILIEDATAARELELYIENDATIYKRRLLPAYKNLITKMAREQYDSRKAAKLMMYTVNDAAKQYSKDYSQGEAIFDKKTKEMVADSLVKNFEAEAKLGNYNDLLPKKYQ